MLQLAKSSSLPTLSRGQAQDGLLGGGCSKQHQLARAALQIITTPGRCESDAGCQYTQSSILSAALRRKTADHSRYQARQAATLIALDGAGSDRTQTSLQNCKTTSQGSTGLLSPKAAQEQTSATLIAAFSEIWGEWGLGTVRQRNFFHLGCGNGHVVLEVCRAFPTCHGVGLEPDAVLVQSARADAELQGLSTRCVFRVGSADEGSLADATAVLLSEPRMMANSAQLLSRLGLQRGTLVIGIGRPLLPQAGSTLAPLLFNGMESSGLFCYFWTGKEAPPSNEDDQALGADICYDEVASEVTAEVQEVASVQLSTVADPCLTTSSSASSLPFLRRASARGAVARQAGAIECTRLSPVRRPRKTTWTHTEWVRPKQILFSRPCISERFSCGKLVQETIDDLRSGAISPEGIPRISVVRQAGRLLTLDHRRLFAFQQGLPDDAEIEVGIVDGDFYPDRAGGCVPEKCSSYQAVQVERLRDRFTYWAPCAGVAVYPKT